MDPFFAKLGGSVVAGIIKGAADAYNKVDLEDLFVRVYAKWTEGVPANLAQSESERKAFESFFTWDNTIKELTKLTRDQGEDIDMVVLAERMRQCYAEAQCEMPEARLWPVLETMVTGLQEALHKTPEYAAAFEIPLRNAVANLNRLERAFPNHSLARHAYLREMRYQHGDVRFRGFAEVGGPTEVNLDSVFVMPRLQPLREDREKTEPASAGELLPARKPAVVLGKPGGGKTTLLQHFALRQSERGLLPVFYRLRQYEKDRQAHPGSDLLECLHHYLRAEYHLHLPSGFFRKQMTENGLLLLLDGLDEVSDVASRQRMVECIEAFVRTLPPQSRVIVTSRPHDYELVRFSSRDYLHFDLCEFNNDEVQAFIANWRKLHEPGKAERARGGEELWQTLRGSEQMMALARNALLLTMIVRVHWTLGLPDSRLDLYRKCSETLLKYWHNPAGLGEGPLPMELKRDFLGKLAFEMQTSAGSLRQDLQIEKAELREKLQSFLKQMGEPVRIAEELIERLQKRDAILVNLGGEQFGFVHRTFQEFFAAYHIAQEELPLEPYLDRYDWRETVCLAVAQLKAKRRRDCLVELLERSHAELALACLKASGKQEEWLDSMVKSLARYTWEGRAFAGAPPDDCFAVAGDRPEFRQVLEAIFHQREDGQVLAAAVELAEAAGLQTLLDGFFALGRKFEKRMVNVPAGEFVYGEGEDQRTTPMPSFQIDRCLVTNAEYECMVPGHKRLRNEYSSTDDQPVIRVNWYEARLFARWRGCRLPTEQEWEKAASWDAKKRVKLEYPWGNEFDSAKCNTAESPNNGTTPVNRYSTFSSPYGCLDMAGNVWEWMHDDHEIEGRKVLRGGSWFNDGCIARCVSRDSSDPADRYNYVGFRCSRT